MAKRLTGLNPLAYLGVNPSGANAPAQAITDDRDPTVNDYDGFDIQCQWLNKVTYETWILVNKANFIATWVQLSSSAGDVETLTGNIGGAVSPTGSNINVVGSGVYVFDGNPGTSTLTLTDNGEVATNYVADSGIAQPSANSINIIGGLNITTSAATDTVTIDLNGTTNHAVQIGNATNSLTSITVGGDGQVLIAANSADPAFSTLTSSGGTIVFTPGANTLNLEAVLNPGSLQIDCDSGSASPVAGILNVIGGDNITTTGSGNTIEASVSGTSDHAVQIGNSVGSLTSITVGGDGQVLIAANAADPAFSTLTSIGGSIVFTPGPNSLNLEATAFGPLTITTDSGSASPAGGNLNVFGGDSITISGAADTVTVSVSGATEFSPQMGTSTGALQDVGVMTTGQLMIGVTGLAPNLATLTPGSNITIDDTSVPGNIIISSTGGGGGGGGVKITTFDVSGTFTKDADSATITYYIYSGGGGGGSGARSATYASGGGGGSSPGFTIYTIPSMYVGSSQTITVGSAGIGGAAVVTDNTAGNNGAEPTHSEVGTAYTVTGGSDLYPALRYWAGEGGRQTSGSALGGAAGKGLYFFTGNTSSNQPPNIPFTGGAGRGNASTPGETPINSTIFGAMGLGGGGAGVNGTATSTGGDGSIVESPYNGTFTYGIPGAGGAVGSPGGNGTDALGNDSLFQVAGTGGGGAGGPSGALATGNGYIGGDGGFPSGGGGGGSGCKNTYTSGVGGDGAAGQVIIIEYLDGSGGSSCCLTWNVVIVTSTSMAVNNGYITNNGSLVTLTLPTVSAVGDIVRVTGKGSGGWKIAQNAGETIYFGSVNTTTGVAGYLASNDPLDSVELVCTTANDDWVVLSSVGTLIYV
jgi:hypothetical protein